MLRNSLQGIQKSLFPLLAGIGELVGRTLICLTIPVLLNRGPITSEANDLSLLGLSFADPLAWLFATSFLIYGTIKYIFKEPKKVELAY